MTAEQRGELLGRAMASAPARAQAKQPALSAADSLPQPDQLAGLVLLQVVQTAVPQALRNKIRWSAERYARLEHVLQNTQTLRLDVTNGKSVWRVDDGRSMRKDTVLRLLNAGVLIAAE
jgi:SRSO17 transposase